MSATELPEELITLIEVIAEGGTLGTWFERLSGMSEVARVAELQRMVVEMETGGEDAVTIAAVRMLAHPHVYFGACSALEIARSRR